MRFSIFTPTHNVAFLGEAYASLVAQTCSDWEWVIVPNGTAMVPAEIAADPRVRVLRAPDDVAAKGVGALKRFACNACHGDYLVELDHDDMLVTHALARIDETINATNADFLYSDAAAFREDGTCHLYGKEWGWEHYGFHYAGRDYIVNRSFPPNASSLSAIHHAPDHVRVWRAATYAQIGGHDPLLAVCDDYDLVCRTYLAGATFAYIPACLYLYRMQADGNNTFLQRNAEIQTKQQEVSNRYIYALVAEWCRREGLPMYDLGGGINRAAGYLSVDVREGADVVCDVRAGLPFADSSVGCIRAADFLEHIPHCADSTCNHGASWGGQRCVVGVMNEIHRVLVPGGWLLSSTPSTDGRGAWQDPTHVSGWNPNSFWYYTRRQQRQFVRGITARFQGTRVWQDFPSEWHKTHNIPYVYADLVALKEQRQPGICEV